MFDNNLRRGSAGAAGGAYEIEKSLRFDGSSAYLTKTPTAGDRDVWTFSCWYKPAGGPEGSTNAFVLFQADSSTVDTYQFSDSKLNMTIQSGSNTDTASSGVFRDGSSWYHICSSYDGSHLRLYINGVLDKTTSNSGDAKINSNVAHYIGQNGGSARYLGGYLAEFHFVDGTAKAASDFGETNADTGQWIPKKYTGSHGSQGYYLKFDDTSNFGLDSSGNGNNWTANNFSASAGVGDDSSLDTPTNNCCTMSNTDHGGITVSNGGLDMGGNTQDKHVRASWALPESGKYYWEVTATTVTSPHYQGVGIAHITASMTSAAFATDGFKMYAATGEKYHDADSGTGFDTFDDGDVISIAVDMDAGKIWAAKNGTWQASGNPATGANPMYDNFLAYSTIKQWHPSWHSFKNGNVASFNFGQRAFTHTVPTGYGPLSVATIPEPTILKGSDHFFTKLYTGDDASTHAITGVGFAPSFIWVKRRSHTSNNFLVDSVRGGTRYLPSESDDPETDDNTVTKSLDADGFTLGSYDGINGDGKTFISWNWKGGSTVTNETGSIDSQVNANPSAGFSVVSYTGTGSDATIGHGLGVVPDVIIVKCRSHTANWGVFHKSLGASYIVQLDVQNAKWQDSGVFNDVLPTSTVFSVDGGSSMSGLSGKTYIAYCFSEVEGYSKFGSYVGNGSSNGPFISTGFKVDYFLVKNASTGSTSWRLYDIKTTGHNPVNKIFYPDDTLAETATIHPVDLNSNGIKIRGTVTETNTNGDTYIYMAFAARPFKYANAR